jgi:hypothetical protein
MPSRANHLGESVVLSVSASLFGITNAFINSGNFLRKLLMFGLSSKPGINNFLEFHSLPLFQSRNTIACSPPLYPTPTP